MSPTLVTAPPGDELALSNEQLGEFDRDGYLIIPNYLSRETCLELLRKTDEMLHAFPIEDHPMTKFATGTDDAGNRTEEKHVGDEYFLSSGDKVRFFFEEAAFGSDGELVKPKERAINKIGHNLHALVPEFGHVSHTGKTGHRNAIIAQQLGYKDPRLLQSMVICKQPEIGGAVPPHQDSTFLYTDKPSAVGFWIALEDATAENGCLSFAPGSHRRAPIRERFVRKDGGIAFEAVEGDDSWPRDFAREEEQEEEYKLGEVKAGTLVLIHGNILHKSERNLSQKGRIIYTFHVIEGAEQYDERNWLQIPGGPKSFTKLRVFNRS